MNDIGRNPSDDDKYGNVFKWKRAGQRYLMKRLFFTIIHCGLLTNEKGAQKEIVWDTDDALLRSGLRKISKVGRTQLPYRSGSYCSAYSRRMPRKC
jgi:hypothetical protein